MTCIVGLAERGDVWIGGDSLGSNGWTKAGYDTAKVFKLRGFLLGACGSYRVLNLLQFSFTPPWYQGAKDGATREKFMVTEFVPSLRKCLDENGSLSLKDGVSRICDNSSVIVGFGGEVFEVQSDLSVLAPKLRFCAAGSGEIAALGSLRTTHALSQNNVEVGTPGSELSCEERVRLSLEAASEITMSVGDQLNIVHLPKEDLEAEEPRKE